MWGSWAHFTSYATSHWAEFVKIREEQVEGVIPNPLSASPHQATSVNSGSSDSR
jgi:hypothetical protein